MTAPVSDHVQLTITKTGLGISRAGFGTPLVLSANAPWPQLVRTYQSTADVAVDFPNTDSPEFLMAQRLFGQEISPSRIKIGRTLAKPTQSYTLDNVTVVDNFEYSLQAEGEGVTSTDATFTSGVSATSATIAVGLVIALNGVVGKNYTAVGADFPIVVTGDAPGNWFSLAVNQPDNFQIEQDHADPGVVADIIAITKVDNDWYGLLSLYNSKAYVLAISAYIETVKKVYATLSTSTESIVVDAGSGTDLLQSLAANNYKRTSSWWHKSPASFLDGAMFGRFLPTTPGASTAKFLKLVGVVASNLNATNRVNLSARNANHFEGTAGVDITQEGHVVSGDYLDATRNLDALDDDMSKSVLESLIDADTVPFDDEGLALIENEIRGSLGRATESGILAVLPVYTVIVPLAANIPDADRVKREATGIRFTATLRGSIHNVFIDGEVSA